MPTQERKRRSSVSVGPASGDLRTANDLIERIRSDDEEVRTAAWLGAGAIGAPAVTPLADLMVSESMEVARAAKRGLWQIVRWCGRPGADAERKRVNRALLTLLSDKHPQALRREVLWMLSEIGDTKSVKSIAALTDDAELREDARMALERIPGEASAGALQKTYKKAPADFRPAVAESLRRRGVDVTGVPSAKLLPVKPTEVKPL